MAPSQSRARRHSSAPPTQTIPPQAASRGVATLRQIDNARQEACSRVHMLPLDDSDDEVDSQSPVYLSFFSSDPASILSMTNFAPVEFERLWISIRAHMITNWNTGRGRKCAYHGKDVFLMALTVLKNCGKWDVVAAVFRVKAASFQKMILKFLSVLSPFLYETFVAYNSTRFSMRKTILSGHAFKNHPYARYATDVTFQQTNMPAGRMQERSLYYSAKHHLHGYKVEMSVLPNGQAINCTRHHPGSEHDIELFRANGAFHNQALRKSDGDIELADDGPLRAEFPVDWAVIADKGYQGLSREFRAITPHKKQPLRTLTLEQIEVNDSLSHDRVLVENYFGQLCTLWAIASDKYRWDEQNYDMLIHACIALTNVHVRAHPLPQEDGDNYSQYLLRLRQIGESRRDNRIETQQCYRERRRDRMRSMFAAHHETPEVDRAYRTPRYGARARRRLVRTPTPTAPTAPTDASSSDETVLSSPGNPLVE